MNRILGMVSAVLFALLLFACGYLYQEQGRLDALLGQSIKTNQEAAIQLEGAINDIEKRMLRKLRESAARSFRPIHSNYETVGVRVDRLMQSIATFQYELSYSDLSKNTIHQYFMDLDARILKHQETTIFMYDSLLHTSGKNFYHFRTDEIIARIETNRLAWQFQGFHNLAESAEGLDKTEITLLLSLLATKIKTIEFLIAKELSNFGSLRGLCFGWNSIEMHPKQCRVKLGETFEAEIGVVEYTIERPEKEWSLTVDDGTLLDFGVAQIPVYKKKATRLGWHEFTINYRAMDPYTNKTFFDKFTYRYEVVQ